MTQENKPEEIQGTGNVGLAFAILVAFAGLVVSLFGYVSKDGYFELAGAVFGTVGLVIIYRQVRRKGEEVAATQEEINYTASVVKAAYKKLKNIDEHFITDNWQVSGNRVFVYIAEKVYIQFTIIGEQVHIEPLSRKRHKDLGKVLQWYLRRVNEETDRALNTTEMQ